MSGLIFAGEWRFPSGFRGHKIARPARFKAIWWRAVAADMIPATVESEILPNVR